MKLRKSKYDNLWTDTNSGTTTSVYPPPPSMTLEEMKAEIEKAEMEEFKRDFVVPVQVTVSMRRTGKPTLTTPMTIYPDGTWKYE